jgi:hypothetical protein
MADTSREQDAEREAQEQRKEPNVGHTPAQAEGDESTVDEALEKEGGGK